MGRFDCRHHGNTTSNRTTLKNRPLRRKVDSTGSFPSAATVAVEAARYPQRGTSTSTGGAAKLLLCHRNKTTAQASSDQQQSQQQQQQQHFHHHFDEQKQRGPRTWKQSLTCTSKKDPHHQVIEHQNPCDYRAGRYQSFPHHPNHATGVGNGGGTKGKHHHHRRRHSWAPSSSSSSSPFAPTAAPPTLTTTTTTKRYVPVQQPSSTTNSAAMNEVEDSWDSSETMNTMNMAGTRTVKKAAGSGVPYQKATASCQEQHHESTNQTEQNQLKKNRLQETSTISTTTTRQGKKPQNKKKHSSRTRKKARPLAESEDEHDEQDEDHDDHDDDDEQFSAEVIHSLQKRAHAVREKAAVLEFKHQQQRLSLSPERSFSTSHGGGGGGGGGSIRQNHTHDGTPNSTKTTSTAMSSHHRSSTPSTPSALPAKAPWRAATAVVPTTTNTNTALVNHRLAGRDTTTYNTAAAPMTSSKHSASSPRLTRVPTAAAILPPPRTAVRDAHGALPPLHPNSNHNRDDDFDEEDEATSESSYSSDFMTDDSSETSGLPIDTSTSISNDEADRQQLLPQLIPQQQPSLNQAASTTTPRIGILPIELPPVLRRTVGHAGQAFYQHVASPVSSSDDDQEIIAQQYHVPDPPQPPTPPFVVKNLHHPAATTAPKIKKSTSKTTMVPNMTAAATRKSSHVVHLMDGWQASPPESFVHSATMKRNSSSSRNSTDNNGVAVVDGLRQGRRQEDETRVMPPSLALHFSTATVNVGAVSHIVPAALQESAATAVATPAATSFVTNPVTTTPTRKSRGRASSCGAVNLHIPKALRLEYGEHLLYSGAEEEDRSIASSSLHSSNETSPFRPVIPRNIPSSRDVRPPVHLHPNHHHQNHHAAANDLRPPVHHHQNLHAGIQNHGVVHSNINHHNPHQAIPFVTNLTRQVTTSGLSQSSMETPQLQQQQQKQQQQRQINDGLRKWSPDPPAKHISAHNDVQQNSNVISSPSIPLLSSHHHHHHHRDTRSLEGGQKVDPAKRMWSRDGDDDDDDDEYTDAPVIQRATSMRSVPASNKMMALISKFEDFGKAQATAASISTTPPKNIVARPRRALNYNIAMSRRENRQDSFSQGSTPSPNNNSKNSRDGGGSGDGSDEVAAANQEYAGGHGAAVNQQYTAACDHDASCRGARAVMPAASVPRGYFWRTSPVPFHHHRGGGGPDEVRDGLPLDEPDLVVVPSTSTTSTLGDHYFESRQHGQHCDQNDANHATVRSSSNEMKHHFKTMEIDPKSDHNNNNNRLKQWHNGHVVTPSSNPRYLHI
jgi:hypothetical protein